MRAGVRLEKPEKEDGSKERRARAVYVCVLLSSPAFYKLPFRGGIFTNIQDGGVIFQALRGAAKVDESSGVALRHAVLIYSSPLLKVPSRVILKEALSRAQKTRSSIYMRDHQGSAEHENYFGK